jgi:hypothetical protein
MVGMMGIANRTGEFDEEIDQYLRPLISTLASLNDAWRISVHHFLCRFDLLIGEVACGFFGNWQSV